MELGLTDKVVIITGAGAGIGLATARAFLAEGARVVGGDLDPNALKDLQGRHAVLAVTVDLASPDGPAELIDRAVAEHGTVDVLVNNVGFYPMRDGFLAVTDADWQEMLNLNLMAMVRACRAAIPHMVAQGRGSIVSIASDVGRQPDAFFVDYGVSKAGVLSLSKALSIEFGPKGIRSNAVNPGPTRTPAWDRPGGFAKALAHEFGLEDNDAAVEHFAKEVRKLPLGRVNRPEDVAPVLLFLASDAARQVTGSVYAVDAGVIAAA